VQVVLITVSLAWLARQEGRSEEARELKGTPLGWSNPATFRIGDVNRVLAEAVRQEAVAGEFSQIEMGRSRIWEFEKRGGAKQVGLD
jgi:hypothetical protein